MPRLSLPMGRAAPWLALAVGAISAFAYQPVALWPLMPVAFALLAAMLRQAPTAKRAFFIGWMFGLGQFVIGLNWIATAFTYQAAMPAWLGWLAVFLLSLYLSIYPALAALVAYVAGRKRPLALVLALAGGWGIAEYLRAIVFTGFVWNPVGASLVPTVFRESSAFLGTYGLSALTVLLGGALFLAVRQQWRGAAAIAAAGIVAACAPLALPQPENSDAPTIRIVQPDIDQDEKWQPDFDVEANRRLQELSRPGPKADIVFWPEVAVTRAMVDERVAGIPGAGFERVRAVQAIGSNQVLVTGGVGLSSADGRNIDGATNSVFVLTADAQVRARYDKAHLVPYGEYLPLRSLLEPLGLSRLAPGDFDFDAGPGAQSVELPDGLGRMGLQICYEIIFSGEVVDGANRPDFLFNPSNDAWFGAWGPPQHLAQARLRAAEEGLPVIRSTPNGISALIDHRGRLLDTIPEGVAGVIDAALPAPAAPTPFARLGNLLSMLVCLLLVGLGIAVARRAR